jgi:hypothetical protein
VTAITGHLAPAHPHVVILISDRPSDGGIVLETRPTDPDPTRLPPPRKRGDGWLAVLAVPLVIACCGLGPLLLVGIASVGAGLAGGAMIAAVVLAVGVGLIVVRTRRRRTCAASAPRTAREKGL